MWAVRKAERSGVVLRRAESRADLHEWYWLYLRALRSGAVLPRPYRFFEHLWKTMVPRGMMELLLAEVEDGRSTTLIAGSLFLRSGNTVFYVFNGRDERHLDLRPNEAIQWSAIQAASLAGFTWYDLGEADEGSSLGTFKSKWATHQEWLMRYYHPPAAAETRDVRRPWETELAARVWRRLPLRVTAALGDGLGRFL